MLNHPYFLKSKQRFPNSAVHCVFSVMFQTLIGHNFFWYVSWIQVIKFYMMYTWQLFIYCEGKHKKVSKFLQSSFALSVCIFIEVKSGYIIISMRNNFMNLKSIQNFNYTVLSKKVYFMASLLVLIWAWDIFSLILLHLYYVWFMVMSTFLCFLHPWFPIYPQNSHWLQMLK